ncbi:MAG TPA: hypothetical protein VIJ43_02335, partial [Burkholderiales bacterium]
MKNARQRGEPDGDKERKLAHAARERASLDRGLKRGDLDGAIKRGDLDSALKRSDLDGALKRAKALKLMVFDVDGVMTDGTLYYSERGEELKAFNVQDGHGIKMLKQHGVDVALITARRSRAVELRAANLGIA